jgi:hypothetical protein
MKAESFNFDLGVKNYKKNRLIVDEIHLTNEIRYTTETSNKPDFNISIISHNNSNDYPLGFVDMIKSLEVDNLSNSFNFFINRSGNMITDVEMKDDTLLGDTLDNKTNVVICLDGISKNVDNAGSRGLLYSYSQIKTLSLALETFYYETRSTTFSELTVSNELEKLTNCGFDIASYIKELEID